MPSWKICLQKTCKWNTKPEFTTYKQMHWHYWNHGRETVICLAKQTGISNNPYGETTHVLVDKLIKLSKVFVK